MRSRLGFLFENRDVLHKMTAPVSYFPAKYLPVFPIARFLVTVVSLYFIRRLSWILHTSRAVVCHVPVFRTKHLLCSRNCPPYDGVSIPLKVPGGGIRSHGMPDRNSREKPRENSRKPLGNLRRIPWNPVAFRVGTRWNDRDYPRYTGIRWAVTGPHGEFPNSWGLFTNRPPYVVLTCARG